MSEAFYESKIDRMRDEISEKHKRIAELEQFVSSLAKIQNLEGWQGVHFRRARELMEKK